MHELTDISDPRMLSFNSTRLILGGIAPFSSIKMALIRPATPLALSMWPTFGLADPTCTGVESSLTKAPRIAAISAPRRK